MRDGPRLQESKELCTALLNCDYFRERGATHVELVRFTARHVSQVYHVKVQFEDKKGLYWIKASRAAEEEYRFLQGVYEHFRNVPQLSVVKPTTYLSRLGALVTEHAEGDLLSSRIKRRLNRVSALLGNDEPIRRACYMCGKWLALLHSLGLPSNQQYSVEELVEYVDVRLRLLINRSGFEGRLRQRVLDYLVEVLSSVPAEDLTRVKTHGDYAPYNVLLSGEELVVLDPSAGGYFGRLGNYCSRYEDIVHFGNFMQGMSPHIVGRQTRKGLVAWFLKGYNDHTGLRVDESSAMFKAFLIKYRLLEVLSAWPSIRNGLIGEKRRLRGFCRWFDTACNR